MKIQYTDEQTLAMRKLYGYFIEAGDLVFNVGANEGRRTQIFLDLGARVIAFEPQPALVISLRERFEGQKNVSVLELAVGGASARVPLWLCTDNRLATCQREWAEALRDRWPMERWQRSITVTQTTLDIQIAVSGLPQFIKIDVEGYEKEVIRGLSHRVGTLCFEATIPFVEPAIECVEDLAWRLGFTRFNYLVQERMELVLEEWVSPIRMEQILLNLPESTLCADVFAR